MHKRIDLSFHGFTNNDSQAEEAHPVTEVEPAEAQSISDAQAEEAHSVTEAQSVTSVLFL